MSFPEAAGSVETTAASSGSAADVAELIQEATASAPLTSSRDESRPSSGSEENMEGPAEGAGMLAKGAKNALLKWCKTHKGVAGTAVLCVAMIGMAVLKPLARGK
jgi:hypothetical protein